MNRKEWVASKCRHKYFWYNKARKIQRSLKYNTDSSAIVIHHLRDTEEQRKYNDEHYEMFGFEIDENGNEHFEYGKYVVFWTEDYHSRYHAQSEETRKKISESNKNNYPYERRLKVSKVHKNKTVSKETREKLSIAGKNRSPASAETRKKLSENNARFNLGKHLSDETKRRISRSRKGKHAGKNHHFYGKHLSDEHIEKLSKSHIGHYHTEETKEKMSNSQKAAWARDSSRRLVQSERFSGPGNPNYGIHLSDERKNEISKTQKEIWSDSNYKDKMRALHIGIKHSDEHKVKIGVANSSRMKIITAEYTKHKEEGGHLTWNEFQKYFKTVHSHNKEDE
jgi:hypothetical protein